MNIIRDEGETQARSQRRGGHETRRRLVECAVEVFADRGYHAATLSEIAAKAGLTTGAVYSTFGSKKALLLAAVSEGAPDDDLEVALTGDHDLRRALEGMVLQRVRTGFDATALRLLRLQVELLKLGLREPELFATLSATGRQQLDALAGLIQDLAAREGVELPMPASELVTLLSAMLNGLGLVQLVDPDLVPERVFLRGLHALMGWEQPDGGG